MLTLGPNGELIPDEYTELGKSFFKKARKKAAKSIKQAAKKVVRKVVTGAKTAVKTAGRLTPAYIMSRGAKLLAAKVKGRLDIAQARQKYLTEKAKARYAPPDEEIYEAGPPEEMYYDPSAAYGGYEDQIPPIEDRVDYPALPPVEERITEPAPAPSPAPYIEPSPEVVEYERAPEKQYLEVPSPEEYAAMPTSDEPEDEFAQWTDEWGSPEPFENGDWNGVDGYIVSRASPGQRARIQKRPRRTLSHADKAAQRIRAMARRRSRRSGTLG